MLGLKQFWENSLWPCSIKLCIIWCIKQIVANNTCLLNSLNISPIIFRKETPLPGIVETMCFYFICSPIPDALDFTSRSGRLCSIPIPYRVIKICLPLPQRRFPRSCRFEIDINPGSFVLPCGIKGVIRTTMGGGWCDIFYRKPNHLSTCVF